MSLYEDVASTLRPEIREAIEVSAPCPESANSQHLWQHEVSIVRSGMGGIRRDEWWQCVYCGAIARKNPIPYELRDLHRRLLGDDADEPWWAGP